MKRWSKLRPFLRNEPILMWSVAEYRAKTRQFFSIKVLRCSLISARIILGTVFTTRTNRNNPLLVAHKTDVLILRLPYHACHKRWNFSKCYTIANRGEVLLLHLQLSIMVDEKPTGNASHGIIERITKTFKLFHDAMYGSEIMGICSSCGFSNHNSFHHGCTLRYTSRALLRQQNSPPLITINKTFCFVRSSISIQVQVLWCLLRRQK